MKKAILVDLNHTLISETGEPNKMVVEVVKKLADDYEILIFTAENIKDPAEAKNKVKQFGVAGFFWLNSDQSDVEKKLEMLETIRQSYKVKLLVDNSKKVCRAFADLGIPSMRYKEGDKKD